MRIVYYCIDRTPNNAGNLPVVHVVRICGHVAVKFQAPSAVYTFIPIVTPRVSTYT